MRRSHRLLLGFLLTACFPTAIHAANLLDLLNDLGRWQGVGYGEGYHACQPDPHIIHPPWRQHLESHSSWADRHPMHSTHAHHAWAPRPMDQQSTMPSAYAYDDWAASQPPSQPPIEPPSQPPVGPPPEPPAPPATPAVKTELPEAWKTLSFRVSLDDDLPTVPSVAP